MPFNCRIGLRAHPIYLMKKPFGPVPISGTSRKKHIILCLSLKNFPKFNFSPYLAKLCVVLAPYLYSLSSVRKGDYPT